MKEASLAEVIAAVTALAFLLTVFYGFGFSMPLHISVFTYFTVNDYFRYSVLWLTPAAIVVLAISLLPGILILKLQDTMRTWDSEGIINLRAYKIFSTVVLLVALVGNAFYYPFPDYVRIGTLGIVFGAVWYKSLKTFYLKQSLQRWSSWTGNALLFTPFVLVLAFILGSEHSQRLIHAASQHADTRIVLKDQERLLTGMILLSLDQFILVRDGDNQQVKIIPQSEIRQIIHDN